MSLSLLPFLALLPLAWSLDANSMRERSVYQLVTDRFALPSSGGNSSCNASDRLYCGGKWSTISGHLDYIKGMGFDTIWISPVVENIGGSSGYGQAYHGYWTLDADKLNTNFGTADDLKALSKSIHDAGMYLQVDVVVNHVAAVAAGNSFRTGDSYGFFNQQSQFHPFCRIEDYTNQTSVEECWLGDDTLSLPDINTNDESIRSYWNNWVKQLVSDYSIDTIRIDTVKHVEQAFWPGFTDAAGVFNQGEILYDDPKYVGSYQKNATINPFNYGVYYPLVRAFNTSEGSMSDLVSMVEQVQTNSSDTSLYGSFLNNHDNARFESFVTDTSRVWNAHAYPFVTDGIPYFYYGTEQGFNGGNDPDNREPLWPSGYNTSAGMYQFVSKLNKARKAAAAASSSFYTTQMNITQMTANEVLIVKGPLVSLLSNRGRGQTGGNMTIPAAATGWKSGQTVVDIVTCNPFPTEDNGDLTIAIENGMPKIFLLDSQKGNVCDATSGGSSTPQGAANSRFALDALTLSVGLVGAGAVGLALL